MRGWRVNGALSAGCDKMPLRKKRETASFSHFVVQ